MADFLQNYRLNLLYDELLKVIKEQYSNGNITEKEIKKFIVLMSNTNKLKKALLFL